MNRRGFFLGMGALLAAPTIVRVSSLMPISSTHAELFVPIEVNSIFVETGDFDETGRFIPSGSRSFKHVSDAPISLQKHVAFTQNGFGVATAGDLPEMPGDGQVFGLGHWPPTQADMAALEERIAEQNARQEEREQRRKSDLDAWWENQCHLERAYAEMFKRVA